MSLLDDLRAAPSPRPEHLQAQVARRIDGTTGFLLFGVLYFMLVANTLTLGATIGMIQLQLHVLPAWQGGSFAAAMVAVVVIVFLASWIPFVLWMRRRRRPGRELARDGMIVEGAVAHWSMNSKNQHVTIQLPNGVRISNLMNAWVSPSSHPVGTPVLALFAPDNRYALYFTPAGKGVGASAKRD